MSKKGKILADNGFITDKLPIIYGYEPAEKIAGKPLTSLNEHKKEAFEEIISAFKGDTDYGVSSVDMSDEFSIIVNYQNGTIFKMGTWSDVEYKLNLARTVMEDESIKGKKGYLTMIGTNQCSFRTNDKPAEVPGIVEPSKPLATDANGNPINGESDPDQEAMFNDFNDQSNNANNNNSDGGNGYDNGYGYGDGGYGYGNDYGYDGGYGN